MTTATQLAATNVTPIMVVSNFFTGRVPATEAKMNSLLDVVAIQETSYAANGSSDAELAGYEVLGRDFAKAFPGPTLLDYADDWFIVNTYANAFGYDATPAQVTHFREQAEYFIDLFNGAGITGTDAIAQARGVVIGQILGWAVRTENTPLNVAAGEATAAYLQGSFAYGKNLYDYTPEPVIVEVPVEVPVEPPHDIASFVNGSIDKTGEKSGVPGELNIGSGGNMNTGFSGKRDLTADNEVAIKVHDRGGADRLGTLEADGKVHIDALAGAQAGVPNRGATAVDIAVNLGFGDTTDTRYELTMGFDTDPTIDTNFNVSTFDNAAGFWINSLGVPVMGNDGARNGTGHLIQDSTNAAFNSWLGNPDAPEGTYDVYLSLHDTVTGVTIRQDVVLHLYDVL